MRRALKGPCLLFEDFGDDAVAEAVATLERGAEWVRQYGSVCVSRYVVGSEGRQARVDFVTSPAWRELTGVCSQQPAVHWLAEAGCSWTDPPPAMAVVYTVDVEVLREPGSGRRRGLPERSQLPDVTCWPVVGHPGRILALCAEDAVALCLEALGKWGAAAQPAQLHRLR